jgi:hypothetical protein
MDIFDKFFKKFAYKFDKGYPDMNNSQDVLLLENILSKVMGKEIVLEAFNKSNSIKAAKDFVENSNFAKSNDVKRFTSGKYANRINSSKVKNFDQIKDALINHFNISEDDIEKIDAGAGPAANDSVAGFLLKTKEFGEVYISVSIGKKGLGGKLNEKNFNNNINQYASKENPITVKLIASDKTLEYNNVARAEDVAGDTRNKLKADTALFSPSESKMPIANISLKQSEGFRWAALNNDDTDFRQKFLDAALNDPNFPIELKPNPEFPGKERYEMFKKGTDQRVTLVIVTDAPYTKDPKNIFGNDNPKTVVVGRTFKPEDFKFDENTNTLDIKVDHIYEDLEEINGSPFEPVFIIAQHSGNPYGLDFRAYPKFMAKLPKKGTGIEIKYSDLIK